MKINLTKNKTLFISFNKDNPLFSYSNDHASKYCHDEHTRKLTLFKIEFALTEDNYSTLQHIYIHSAKLFEYNDNCKRFISILKTLTKGYDSPYWKTNFKFNFNYELDEKLNYIFYISGEKEWFLRNGLGELLTFIYPEHWMTSEDMKKFPIYDINCKITRNVGIY